MEIQTLQTLTEHTFKFRLQRDDKGGDTVVITEVRVNEETRTHVENDQVYELGSNFGNVLGVKEDGIRKYQGGTIDDQQVE